jgi:hypothetical protein
MLNASQNQDAAKIKAMQKAATEALRKAQGSR